MRRLSVVVTCTDRKTSPVQPTLRAGSLPAGGVGHRLDIWSERLRTADGRVPLLDLYMGEQWVQAKAVVQAAKQAGFQPMLWVASAGVGLQPATASFPAYGATFSPGHADSVALAGGDRRRWWKGLQDGLGGGRLVDLGRIGPVLLVLSEVYGSVLVPELQELAEGGGEGLVIGGAGKVDGVLRIPANGALRKSLGGTLTGLNARMAVSWLTQCDDAELMSPHTTGSWKRWMERSVQPERYNRVPMTDTEIKEFIRTSVAKEPGISRTRLHRQLRTSGRACEQRRFASLYSETMGER